MILALGAMILLTILILNTNKTTLATEDVMYDSNFGITATSIASSIIEDASKKRFDSVFYDDEDSSAVYDPNLFTPANDLGAETASGEDPEDPKTFNDFDDYDGYTFEDNTMPSAVFDVSCTVVYVEDDDLDNIANSPTFHKKITVKVSSNSMRDVMVISAIYSYWNFLP